MAPAEAQESTGPALSLWLAQYPLGTPPAISKSHPQLHRRTHHPSAVASLLRLRPGLKYGQG